MDYYANDAKARVTIISAITIGALVISLLATTCAIRRMDAETERYKACVEKASDPSRCQVLPVAP